MQSNVCAMQCTNKQSALSRLMEVTTHQRQNGRAIYCNRWRSRPSSNWTAGAPRAPQGHDIDRATGVPWRRRADDSPGAPPARRPGAGGRSHPDTRRPGRSAARRIYHLSLAQPLRRPLRGQVSLRRRQHPAPSPQFDQQTDARVGRHPLVEAPWRSMSRALGNGLRILAPPGCRIQLPTHGLGLAHRY